MGSRLFGGIIAVAAILAPIVTLALYLQVRPLPEAQEDPATDQGIAIAATSAPKGGESEPTKVTIPSVQELAPALATDKENVENLALPTEIPPALETPDEETLLEPNTPASLDGLSGSNERTRETVRREGSVFKDVIGTIAKKGPQILFVPADQSTPLALLESQLLERVEQLEQSRPRTGQPAKWLVSGQVTEYRGSNYLLLSSAILKDGD